TQGDLNNLAIAVSSKHRYRRTGISNNHRTVCWCRNGSRWRLVHDDGPSRDRARAAGVIRRHDRQTMATCWRVDPGPGPRSCGQRGEDAVALTDHDALHRAVTVGGFDGEGNVVTKQHH